MLKMSRITTSANQHLLQNHTIIANIIPPSNISLQLKISQITQNIDIRFTTNQNIKISNQTNKEYHYMRDRIASFKNVQKTEEIFLSTATSTTHIRIIRPRRRHNKYNENIQKHQWISPLSSAPTQHLAVTHIPS